MTRPPYRLRAEASRGSSRFGCIPVASPLHDEAQRRELTARWQEPIARMGGAIRGYDRLRDPEPLTILVLTGGTEREVLAILAERAAARPGEPALLLAHGDHNSLPAALEALARLRQNGTPGRILFVQDPAPPDSLSELEEALDALETRRFLRSVRIGLVGEPSDWLVASRVDPAVLERSWGPKVVEIPLEHIVRHMADVQEEELRLVVGSLSSYAAEVVEPDSGDLDKSGRIYLALRRLVRDHDLAALTLRCFDLLASPACTGCIALSQLADEGVPAGCEGDLPSLLAMLWTARLLRELPWMANPARISPAEGRLLLAHCTVPRTLTDSYRLRSHFESGLGVGLEGTLPPGPVTLLRLGGPALDRLWLTEAEAHPEPAQEGLCRTQLHLRAPREALQELLEAPLGNHLVVVYGHHAERVRRWWGDHVGGA